MTRSKRSTPKFVIDDDLITWIRNTATKQRCSMSQVARDLILAEINKDGKPKDKDKNNISVTENLLARLASDAYFNLADVCLNPGQKLRLPSIFIRIQKDEDDLSYIPIKLPAGTYVKSIEDDLITFVPA